MENVGPQQEAGRLITDVQARGEKAKLIDPLSKVRTAVLQERDSVNGTEDKNIQAQNITDSVRTFALEPYVRGGGDLAELTKKKEQSETLGQEVLAKLVSQIDSNTILGRNSLAMAIEVANAYAAVVFDLADQIQNGNESPPPGNIGYAFTEMYRNGALKDKLTVFTPQEHRFANNFNKAVQTVNEVLGLPKTALLNFGELEHP